MSVDNITGLRDFHRIRYFRRYRDSLPHPRGAQTACMSSERNTQNVYQCALPAVVTIMALWQLRSGLGHKMYAVTHFGKRLHRIPFHALLCSLKIIPGSIYEHLLTMLPNYTLSKCVNE